MTKLSGKELEVFRKAMVIHGAKGGKARAQKYSAAERSAWAHQGGRPRSRPVRNKITTLLLEKMNGRSQSAIAKDIGVTPSCISGILHGNKPGRQVLMYLGLAPKGSKRAASANAKAKDKNRQQITARQTPHSAVAD